MDITHPEEQLPTIAIVGRTNVGKSTLFNRLVAGEPSELGFAHKAIVSPIAGTTRSSNIAVMRWRGERLRVIDTGGMDFTRRLFEAEIEKQLDQVYKKARLIIFLVDLQNGLLPQEKIFSKRLQKLGLPVLLVGNKADNQAARQNSHNPEWLKLSFGEPLPISAINGSGVGDMLDAVFDELKKIGALPELKEEEIAAIKICLLGKPNVGKSTLFNTLIGEERAMVSPEPLTTRESNDTLIIKDNQAYLFVDTAGIRAKPKIEPGVEKFSVQQSLRSLEASDIAMLILDPIQGFSAHDRHLAGLINEKQKALIIIVNKWDLFTEKAEENREKTTADLNFQFPFLSFAPVLFVSAKTRLNTHKIYELIQEVDAAYKKVIPEEELRIFLERITKKRRPVKGKGVRHPKIYSLKQVSNKPPTFEIALKQKTSIHESYLRFIQNQLREEYDLIGTPVIVYAKKI